MSTPTLKSARPRQNKTAEAHERWLEIIAQTSRDGEPEWLQARREHARTLFERAGFPTTRDEEWKYTDPAPMANVILADKFDVGEEKEMHGIEPFLFDAETCCRLVFVNGEYSEELSCICDVPPGMIAQPISQVLRERPELLEEHLAQCADSEANPFVALNTALFEDGVFVKIEEEAICERPLQIVFVTTAQKGVRAIAPRVLIVAGAGSEATIAESYVSPHADVYLNNAVTEVVLGPNAKVDHYKQQMESVNALHVATMQVMAARDAKFFSHAFAFGGRVARSDANAVMQGENCEITLNGLYLGRGEQLIDNHTVMDHAMPHCRSYESYSGILDDKSRGVFNGKIFVRLDAQKTDAKQTNRALLLSNEAEIDTKPQLEIFADDVKCTHGATIGQLDEDALFYLRARGIAEEDARDILIGAFASEVLNNVKVEALRVRLQNELLTRLRRALD
jgi:Fe-S cluster assembly protein SufD